MSMKRKIVICLVAVLAAGGVLYAFLATGHRRELIEFYTPPGDSPLTLELFHPTAGSGPYPVIIYIPHDPLWQDTFAVEGRTQQGIKLLNEAGYVIAIIHHRSHFRASFPGPIQDMKASVRWLRMNAKEHRIDPDHIGVFGASAGAYGACMMATTDAADGFDPPGDSSVSCRVQAVAALAAPADLSRKVWPERVELAFMRPFLGARFEENPEIYRKASPGTYATSDDPPVLLLHSPADKSVPIAQSKAFAEKLQAAGVPVTFVELPETVSHVPSREDFLPIFQRGAEFFNQHLRP